MNESVDVYAPPKVDLEHDYREGDEDAYVPASRTARFVNCIIDGVGSSLALFASILGVAMLKGNAALLTDAEAQLLWAANMVGYYLFFEGMFQRTPGKWLTGTLVVTDDYTRPTFRHVLKRTIARFLPFEALTFLGKHRGFHDRWAKTRVVRVRR